MLQVQRPTFCEGAPSLRSGPGSTFWLSVHAGPSLRSGPGSTFWPPVHALSPGTIFCECPVQRPEPSQRFGFALDTVEGRLTLRVRARSFVRAPCEGAPSLRSDSLRTPWEIVECWTLTSLRSGLNVPGLVKCFKSGHEPSLRSDSR